MKDKSNIPTPYSRRGTINRLSPEILDKSKKGKLGCFPSPDLFETPKDEQDIAKDIADIITDECQDGEIS